MSELKAKQVIAIVDMPGWTARVFDDATVERSGVPGGEVVPEAQLDVLRRVVAEMARVHAHESKLLTWAGNGTNGVLVRIGRENA
jgi:hypothetical protein